LIPPTQGAPRETDFVRATAEEVERRYRIEEVRPGLFVVHGACEPGRPVMSLSEIDAVLNSPTRTEGR
jgi:hypothetical protein